MKEFNSRYPRLLWSLTLLLLLARSGIEAGLTEADYHANYAFSVQRRQPWVERHSNGIHSVIVQYSIRECDVEDGKVAVLTFCENGKHLKSYSLRDLIPDSTKWDFHVATGVYIWPDSDLTRPRRESFVGNTFRIFVDQIEIKFDTTTGERI